MTPRLRIAIGITLIVAGFLMGFVFYIQWRFIDLYSGATAAWVFIISGFVVLLYRWREAPIARGIALVFAPPVALYASFLLQVRGLFPIMMFFFVLGLAVASLGVILIVFELAEKRREEGGA